MNAQAPSFSADAVLNRLRDEGLRITAGRRNILNVLFEAERPLSLQEIQELAASQENSPDYATVFRMIALLDRLHLVHKVNLQRPCTYYELNDPSKHYDHIVCTGCGRVVVIDIPCPLAETEKRVAEHYGFRNLSHSLEFFGRCPNCLEK
ncbi:MAG TPA: transcriptional repressor [Terrimicrobiaceae bacterium]|jgi:Fur family ferric uptake transcriptional regulator|nr:transcriptional repressor [Terrimicrobiaceae bacterium]